MENNKTLDNYSLALLKIEILEKALNEVFHAKSINSVKFISSNALFNAHNAKLDPVKKW